MALSVQGMPGCCGIYVIHSFPYVGNGYTVENLAPMIERELIPIFEKYKHYVLVASMINLQKDAAEPILRKYGFRQVSSNIKNPNTSNQLWVFLYDKKTLKDVKERKFS